MNSIRTNNSYTPSFQAYYKSSYGKRFERALRSADFGEDVVRDFAKVLETRKNKSYKIGEGKHGEVFRIDDYFVFKTYFDQPPKVGPVRINPSTIFDGLRTYCGKVLARIGNVEIIRNATKDKRNFLEMARVLRDGVEAYNHSLREFLSLPQRAFDAIAEDFKKLNEIHEGNIYYWFDTNNSNNFLKVGKSIKIVDDIAITPCSQVNDIFSFLKVFVQKGGGNARMKKAIFKKCILSIEKYQLPMENAFKLEYLKPHVDEIFEAAGVKVSFDDYYKSMTELRANCSDEAVRMTKVREFLETV
ncbi:MAG: hypothetical protein NC191_09390 [Muribaculaceae bacterium]|nr:hypothetical protein [Muribaculaceae bacterium]